MSKKSGRRSTAIAACVEGLELRRLMAGDIAVLGNGHVIGAGDATPSMYDFTDFGNTNSGSGFLDRTFTIQNNGTTALNLGAVTIDGASAADFTVTAQPASATVGLDDAGTTTVKENQTTFTVRYQPQASGGDLRYARVSIASDDGDTPAFQFSVFGTADLVSVGTEGLRYKLVTPGTGPRAAQTDDGLRVNYTGRLVDNATVFDSSLNPGRSPFTFALGTGVIQGWSQGLAGAKDGEARFLVIPPALGYGAAGSGASIPANATLLFDVSVLNVEPPDLKVAGSPDAGGGVELTSGDASPSTAKGTDFGSVAVAGGQVQRSFALFATTLGTVRLVGSTPFTISGANGSDFSVLPGLQSLPNNQVGLIVTFDPTAAGLRTAVVSIATNDPDESPFTFTVQGVGTAPTPPQLPVVTVANASVVEGNAGTANLSFTVTLSAPSVSAVTVAYATGGGTATVGADYTGAQGVLTFAAGETSKTVIVPVVSDSLIEDDETVLLTLSQPSGATIGNTTAVGTIINDDTTSVPVLPTISAANASVIEGNAGAKELTFTVTLSAPSDSAVSVDFATEAGSATPGTDFASATGTLTIPAGATSGTIVVTVNGDLDIEPSETLALVLSNPVGATIGTPNLTGTLVNDDGPDLAVTVPSVAVSPKGLLVGGKGTAKIQVSNKAAADYSGSPLVQWYLSQDGTLDAGDVVLGQSQRPLRLKANGARPTTVPAKFTIPAGTAAGTYRLLGVVDGSAQVIEADETNNVAGSAGTVTVLPSTVDLQVAHSPRGPKITKGKPTALSVKLMNTGTVPFAGSTTIRFTASADGVADTSDIVLGVLGPKPFKVRNGAKSAAVLRLVVPADLPPGTYRLIAEVDREGAVAESSEGNVAVSGWTFTV